MGSDVQPGTEMEIVVEETISVRDCLKLMLKKSGLQGDAWHLRKMDWCYEAGEPLCEEDATLKELLICSGDTLLLIEGQLPPLGFLKVPIWWYQLQGPSGHWESHQDQTNCTSSWGRVWRATSSQGASGNEPAQVSLLYLGDIEISEDATLAELKSQAMTLPPFLEFGVPSPARAFVSAVTLARPGLARPRLKSDAPGDHHPAAGPVRQPDWVRVLETAVRRAWYQPRGHRGGIRHRGH
uniref:cDNA FLJ53044, highly similar to Ubiquitin carboxyl-terminal hydrolase 40 n=1 Tax=Homo sapiens TaxID=9606 RepID=B4DIF7_HUMAN|nr:unnamed protein product [Homo sapiens]